MIASCSNPWADEYIDNANNAKTETTAPNRIDTLLSPDNDCGTQVKIINPNSGIAIIAAINRNHVKLAIINPEVLNIEKA